jgi:hypothetical protein
MSLTDKLVEAVGDSDPEFSLGIAAMSVFCFDKSVRCILLKNDLTTFVHVAMQEILCFIVSAVS